jgi:hypothetical protein
MSGVRWRKVCAVPAPASVSNSAGIAPPPSGLCPRGRWPDRGPRSASGPREAWQPDGALAPPACFGYAPGDLPGRGTVWPPGRAAAARCSGADSCGRRPAWQTGCHRAPGAGFIGHPRAPTRGTLASPGVHRPEPGPLRTDPGHRASPSTRARHAGAPPERQAWSVAPTALPRRRPACQSARRSSAVSPAPTCVDAPGPSRRRS